MKKEEYDNFIEEDELIEDSLDMEIEGMGYDELVPEIPVGNIPCDIPSLNMLPYRDKIRKIHLWQEVAKTNEQTLGRYLKKQIGDKLGSGMLFLSQDNYDYLAYRVTPADKRWMKIFPDPELGNKEVRFEEGGIPYPRNGDTDDTDN